MTTTSTITRCPAGPHHKPADRYLCRPCWYQLPEAARTALWRRDSLAVRRLSELRDQLRNDVPLSEVQVTS